MNDLPEIPRKSNVREGDFLPELVGKIRVLIDGVEIDKTFAYDIDEGFVLAYETDAEGNMFLCKCGDEPAWHRLDGNVEVILK